jgi:hypothetical protein
VSRIALFLATSPVLGQRLAVDRMREIQLAVLPTFFDFSHRQYISHTSSWRPSHAGGWPSQAGGQPERDARRSFIP